MNEKMTAKILSTFEIIITMDDSLNKDFIMDRYSVTTSVVS